MNSVNFILFRTCDCNSNTVLFCSSETLLNDAKHVLLLRLSGRNRNPKTMNECLTHIITTREKEVSSQDVE